MARVVVATVNPLSSRTVTVIVNVPARAYVWPPTTHSPPGIASITPALEVPSPQWIVAVKWPGDSGSRPGPR